MADPERSKQQSSVSTGDSAVIKPKRLRTSDLRWLEKEKETVSCEHKDLNIGGAFEKCVNSVF